MCPRQHCTLAATRSVAAGAADAELVIQPLAANLSLISGAGGNVVLLNSPDGVLLVDGGAREHSARLLKAVRTIAGTARVHTLFNTHWHADQTGSNATLGAAGTRIIAHEYTRQWLTTDVESKWEQRVYQPLPKIAQPNQTFYTTGSLEFGGEKIDYGHMPQAHTDGDIYVYFRKANVLVAGDVVSVGRFPIIDYCTNGWKVHGKRCPPGLGRRPVANGFGDAHLQAGRDRRRGRAGGVAGLDSSENGNNNWYAVRLKVEPGNKVSEIEVLVNRSISGPQGAAGGAPPRQNTEVHSLMAQELPVSSRLTREQLASISDSYFTGLDTEGKRTQRAFLARLPASREWHHYREQPGCATGNYGLVGLQDAVRHGLLGDRHRHSRATIRAGGSRKRDSPLPGPISITTAQWRNSPNTPDRKLADVAPVFRQPISFYIAEVFKVVDGNIRQIEAVLTTVPYQMESGW